MLELDGVSKVYKIGMFGEARADRGPRRLASPSRPARSSP